MTRLAKRVMQAKNQDERKKRKLAKTTQHDLWDDDSQESLCISINLVYT